MNAIVSVIMPVYNTAPYLRMAIDSVVGQTFEAWELILIDDGSTDGSAQICDAYAREDSRIRVIHAGHHGVSHARNLGLEQATGTWVAFLDSDDELELTALEELLRGADGADVVMGNFRFNEDENHKIEDQQTVTLPSMTDQQAQALFFCDFFFVVWGRLYRREKLLRRFPEGMSYGEDTCFNLRSVWDWERVSLIPKCVVTHYGRYGSLSNRNCLDMPQRLRRILEQYRETFAGYSGMKQVAFEHYSELLRHFCWLHIHTIAMTEAEKKLILSVWLSDESIDREAGEAAELQGEQAAFWQMVLRQDTEGIYKMLQ